MATINSKKLLPGSEKKEVFLVPTKSIVPSAPKLDGVKPSEKKATKSSPKIEGKIIQVTELFNNSLLLKAADRERKRKEEERKEFEEREKKLEEKKLGKKGQQESLVSKIPGSSIFDTLARFTGFTLLGFVFNNYSNLLPKLTALGAIIKPAAVGLEYFAEGILSGTIDWIEKGYKAYDTVRDWTKQLGGENFQKLFDDFSGALNIFLNTAVIAGLAGIKGGGLSLKGKGLGDLISRPSSAAGPLEKQIKDAKRYLSKYSFRTVKETAPITESRILNMLTRTAMGLPAAKMLPTKEALKDPKFARAYTPQKKTYVSTSDRALAKSISLGGEEVSTLRKAGVGTLLPSDQKNVNSIKYKIGKNIGLSDKQISSILGVSKPETPPRPKPKPKKIKPTTVTAETVEKGVSKIPIGDSLKSLGGLNAVNIAKAKAKFAKLGLSNIDLISIANNVEGAAQVDRKAAYEILKKRGLAGRVINVPEFPSIPTTRIKPQKPQIQPAQEIVPRPRGTQGVFGRGVGRVAQRAALKIGGRTAAKFVRGIPVVGALVDFLFSLAMGDPPDEAAAGAAGAAIGAAVAGLVVGSGTFGLGAFLGGVIGGLAGDIIGRFLYKTAKAIFGKKEKPKKYAQGGVVGSRRRIRATQKIKSKGREPSPAYTRPGFTEKDLEYVYGKQSAKSTVDIIKNVSINLGEIAMFNGFLGSLMAGSINLLLGQKFDSGLLRYIGQKYGKQTENGVRSAGDAVINLLRRFITFKKEGGGDLDLTGGGGGGGGGASEPPLREPKRSDYPMGRGGTKAFENALKRYQSEKAKRAQAQPQTPALPSGSGGLIDTGYKDSQGRPIKLKGAAADAFIQMAADAKKQGIDIGPGVSNAFRTPEHNVAVGGASGSRHMQGLAFDINWYSNAGKWIRENAPGYGFRFNDYSGTSTHFDYIGGGAKIKPATTPSSPELGPQSSTKKDDAQKVAMNTSYEVVSNSVLMVKTLIQPIMA